MFQNFRAPKIRHFIKSLQNMSALNQNLFEGIRLYQFKKHAELEIALHPRFNCWLGKNGAGKTNALDALHYLCLTKSYFHRTDLLSIQHGQEETSIKGWGQFNEQPFEVLCNLRKNGKKTFSVNEKSLNKLSDHIGWQPVVVIAPQDQMLITETAEERRKWMDSAISQTSPAYLQALVKYNHLLQQRNALLKSQHERKTNQIEDIIWYDELLLEWVKVIEKERAQLVAFMAEQLPLLIQYFSSDHDQCSLALQNNYHPEQYLQQLSSAYQQDWHAERTSIGPHKDDLNFQLGEYPIRKMGSQGQQKTFVLALKLAQLLFIQTYSSKNPLLLLDDIHDKLDAQRLGNLFTWLNENIQGQVVITDTDDDRIPSILAAMNAEHSKILFS
jgi:DNA replication and repair protein RecF